MSKEFYYQVEPEVLRKGLKAHAGDIAPAVEEAFGFEMTKDGMEPYTPITVLAEYSQNWPFPWVKSENGLMFSVSQVDPSTVHLESWNGGSNTSISNWAYPGFTVADLPEMVSFGNYTVFMGTFGIFGGLQGSMAAISETVMPRGRTCCNFKGQMIVGGILSDWYDCDETFVAFSNVGDISMELDYKNVSGYKPVKFVGKVYRVRRLEHIVVVYGSNGVSYLAPATSPTPTFGEKEIINAPLASPAAADGGVSWHAFVDGYGNLWIVSKDDGARRLGYKDAISQMTLSQVVVSYDALNDRFFISDGTYCFLLTRHGLTEVYQIVSGVGNQYGTAYGFCSEDAAEMAVTVGPFDFGYRGLKMLYTVESDMPGTLQVLTRYDRSNNYTNVKSVPINNVGVCTPMVAGEAFKLRFVDDSYSGVYPSQLLLRWKMHDLRGMRGYYKPES